MWRVDHSNRSSERAPRRAIRMAVCAGAALAAGCRGVQSALDPAGREAGRLADIFWVMTVGAVIVWIATIALAIYAARVRPEAHGERWARRLIVIAGAVTPTVVLGALLIYGLLPIPALMAPAPPDSLRIKVSGEQWWWRVRYEPAGGPSGSEAVDLANEIRLPVGEPAQFELDSPDVIHSFWIPSLAGKMDMIPGRLTRLAVKPTKTGEFRGVCAEYCGASHALMAFPVVVMEKEEFNRWLAAQSRPAETPADPLAARGQQSFLANGCNACHTVRGTQANGVIGPDLTHVGGRLSLAAGILPNEPAEFHRWIALTKEVKPGVLMPKFNMLPPDELRALAAYLEGLK